MKRGQRKNLWRRAVVFFLTAVMCVPQLGVSAETKYNFKTSYTIHDGVDGYFIAENSDGKYDLLNEEGDNVNEDENFQYDSMEFLTDSEQCSYVKVKKDNAYGILDLEGNEVIKTGYDEIDAYADGNTVAAAFNGADTELFETDGKEYGKRLTGKYSVISNTVFLGEKDIVNENGNKLLDLQKESMLDADGNAKVVKMGEYYAVQKYVEQPEVIGDNLKADQYVEIYKDDELETAVKPEENWNEDDGSASITGSLKLVRKVSDKSLLLKMDFGDEEKNFYVIYTYDPDQEEFSEKFEVVGEFTDGKAFAKEFEGDAFYVIDEKGGTQEISIPKGYKAQAKSLEQATEASLLKLKKNKENFKLCTLDGTILDKTWDGVKFLGNNCTRVKNEDGEYGILDKEGKEIVKYGEFTGDVITEKDAVLCSDTGVTIKKQSGSKTEIYYYETAKKEEKSFFEEHKLQIVIGAAAVAVLFILIVVIFVVRRRKKQAVEEQLERQRQEEMRKKAAAGRRPGISNRPNISDAPGGQIHRASRRSEQPVKRPMNSHSEPEGKAVAPGLHSAGKTFSGAGGYLTGIAGEFAGAVLRIGDGKRIKLGRDNSCDVILKNPKASRRHCIIGYDGKSGKYQVVDYSTNGVYLSGGKRLPKEKAVWLSEGTTLFIGNNKTVFRLGKQG